MKLVLDSLSLVNLMNLHSTQLQGHFLHSSLLPHHMTTDKQFHVAYTTSANLKDKYLVIKTFEHFQL